MESILKPSERITQTVQTADCGHLAQVPYQVGMPQNSTCNLSGKASVHCHSHPVHCNSHPVHCHSHPVHFHSHPRYTVTHIIGTLSLTSSVHCHSHPRYTVTHILGTLSLTSASNIAQPFLGRRRRTSQIFLAQNSAQVRQTLCRYCPHSIGT